MSFLLENSMHFCCQKLKNRPLTLFLFVFDTVVLPLHTAVLVAELISLFKFAYTAKVLISYYVDVPIVL